MVGLLSLLTLTLHLLLITGLGNADAAAAGGDSAAKARELETSLFANYSWKWRPALVKGHKTLVTVGLYIRDVNFVDEHQQVLTVHGGLNMLWNDNRLRWTPQQGGPYYLAAPNWKLWKPDWTVYNTYQPAGSYNKWPYQYQQAWVHFDGTVSYYTTLHKRITCSFDFSRYPFDTQTCTMLIGSWMYDYAQLDMRWSPARRVTVNLQWLGSPDNRTGAGQWALEDVRLSKRYLHDDYTLLYDPPPLGYDPSRLWPLLSVEFVLRRRRPCYGLLEFSPLLLTCLVTMACFGIVRSEPVAVGALALCLLVQAACSWSIVARMPTGGTGGPPKIAQAYGACFGLTSMALLVHIMLCWARGTAAGRHLVGRLLVGDRRSSWSGGWRGRCQWLGGLQGAVRIASFATDYQEIVQLTDPSPQSLTTTSNYQQDQLDPIKFERAISAAKNILCALFALLYLVCLPITFL